MLDALDQSLEILSSNSCSSASSPSSASYPEKPQQKAKVDAHSADFSEPPGGAAGVQQSTFAHTWPGCYRQHTARTNDKHTLARPSSEQEVNSVGQGSTEQNTEPEVVNDSTNYEAEGLA